MFDEYDLVRVKYDDEHGVDRWLHEDSGFYFDKDESGQWWVDTGNGERGPFNTLEHACDCMCNLV